MFFFSNITIGTRFFEKDPSKVTKIIDFVKKARLVAARVLIAINGAEDQTGAVANVNSLGCSYDQVDAFPVMPWGKFVMPLNALIMKAALAKSVYLLMASVETADSLTLENLTILYSHMDGDTLVAGAAMVGHELREGYRQGNGVSVPWNTFALWNLGMLSKFGVPLIGDALFDQTQAGVEEVATIALYQKLFTPLHARAKLVELPGMKWDVSDLDTERLTVHEKKMDSKVTRPNKQLQVVRVLPDPVVEHIRKYVPVEAKLAREKKAYYKSAR